jgi:hypothetical protein
MADDSNSVIWIKNNVIAFFASKYRTPNELFNWDSNVRQAFALLPSARWQSLGRELNRAGFLISINVIIDADGKPWGRCSTIGEITMLIHGMYIKHRNFVTTLKLDKSVAAALAGTSARKPKKKKAKADA